VLNPTDDIEVKLTIDVPDGLPPKCRRESRPGPKSRPRSVAATLMKTLQRIEGRRADALIKDVVQRSEAGEANWEALVDGLGRNHAPATALWFGVNSSSQRPRAENRQNQAQAVILTAGCLVVRQPETAWGGPILGLR